MIMPTPLRIALIYPQSARDIRTWSGTPYFMARALSTHLGTIIDLSPSRVPVLPYRVFAKLTALVTGRRVPYNHLRHYSRRIGRDFTRRLRAVDADLVLAPGGSESIAYLETDLPIVYYSDATWQNVIDYYRVYSNLHSMVRRSGEEIERRAISRSRLLLYPSHWAADSAIRDYGADPQRVRVDFLGANLLDPPTRASVSDRSLGATLRLLLIGVDWWIKGGDVALRVLTGLLDRGVDAELTVVGCTAPDGVAHPRLRVIPFLNKGIDEERQRFESLLHEADFFILPSRFEAAGLVFCEASAYGLPILAARTGGIPSLVAEGRNGFTIAHDDEPEGYIETILRLRADPEEYRRLCATTREEYDNRLNWDIWGEKVADAIAGLSPEFRERIEAHREVGSGD
jgi:glycosyltransferase involved in cell wall biosynthesis